MINKILFTLFFLVSIISNLGAGTTGKVTGIVSDSETNEPLMGVNVYLDGTSLGASTDLDGYFVILNVSAGTYDLKAAYIGYADFTALNLRVNIDLTATINIELQSEILMSEVVVVEASRPVVIRDVSNSQLNIEAKTIESLPIQNVNQVLTLQAGIQMGTEGILVRGGGANQTVFMVDGFSLNDERSNIPYTAISLSSIEELKVQTGGFNAEYGNARSGLVNMMTKDGRRDQYNASITFNYMSAGRKQLGPSLFSENSYFNRPFMDTDVCWTGTANGGWDENMRKQYPNFDGWNAVSENTLTDNDPNNDLTPEGAKQLFEWQRRRQGDIEEPDYYIDAGFGGPMPFVSKSLGNLRFFVSHTREKEMFIFPLSRDAYSVNNTQAKFTSDITDNMKLVVTGLYGETHSVSPYSWTTTPTGRVLRTDGEVANLANDASVIYMPDYYSPSSVYRTMVGTQLTHVLSPKTFYEVSLQHMRNQYNTFQATLRDTAKTYEPVEGYYVDEAPYGYWGYSSSGIDGMSLGGWMNLGRDNSINSTTTLKYDLTTQFNSENQIKAGINFVYNDYNIKSSTQSPSMSTWTRSMIYHIFPYRLGIYAQDKLEYQGFVANLGLRLDYSDANSDMYVLDQYDKNLQSGYGNSLEDIVDTKDSKASWYLSPRLGVSHPITETSKLYFNYGHFRSEASSSYRFRIQRESSGLVTSMGDPNLEMEKTVAYELGFEKSLYDQVLVKLAGYYKDVSDQPGWIYYQDINGHVKYNKSDNNNYADIRGFEITLSKRTGRWITGFINYTYDVTSSGYFGLLEYWEDPQKQREYLIENPVQSKPHPRPYARANINIHSPDDYGVQILGINPLGGWNLNILADWKAGAFSTYNPNYTPGVVDNVRYRDYQNVDFRFSKTFDIANYSMQFYTDITNVFNVKRFNYAGFSDSFDRENYLQSLRFSDETGDQKGNDKIGDYRPVGVAFDPLEANPGNDPEIAARNIKRIDKKSYIDMPNIKALTFLYPRTVTFGVKISF